MARALRAGLGSAAHLTAIVAPQPAPEWVLGFVDDFRLLGDSWPASDALLALALSLNEEGGLDGVIPCDALSAAGIARSSDRLGAHGIGTLLPPPSRAHLMSKPALYRSLVGHGVPMPLTRGIERIENAGRVTAGMAFPLWVRHAEGSAVRVGDSCEMIVAAEHLAALGPGELLLQCALPGDGYEVAMVCPGAHETPRMVMMRRLAVGENGETVCGSVVDDPEIAAFAIGVHEKLSWRGPLTLEIVRAPRSTDLFLADVSCCLPPWSMLTHWSGCNLALELVDRMLGERRPSPVPSPKIGALFIRGVTETGVGAARSDPPACGAGPERRRTRAAGVGVPAHGLRVAVTGISTFDVVNPGLGVAHALRHAPEVSRLIGLGYGTFDVGAYTGGLFDAAFALPPATGLSALRQRLCEIHAKCPFDVVIPCLDGELSGFIRLRETFDDLGVRTLLPNEQALERRSKVSLFGGGLASAWGSFRIPQSVVVDSEAGAVRAAARLGLPVMVKGAMSRCIPVRSPEEVGYAWRQLERLGECPVIVQARVSGPSHAVATVFARDHQPLSTLAIRKLDICERGSTWCARHEANAPLEADFCRLLAGIGWTGPAEGEFIHDEARGRFYLIEVNPRFTAWIYYSALLGINHPRLAVQAAMRRPFSVPRIVHPGLRFARIAEEVPIPVTQLAAFSTKGFCTHDAA